MIAIFGHDLRGLLNALTVNSEVFLRRQGDDAAASARTVRLTVARMDKLISSLLDFARLRTGKLEIHRRPLDARVLMQEVVEIFRPLAGSKSVTLALAVPDEPLMVEADPERMFQVLSNLLSNAIEFSSARGRICLEGAVSGADVELSVVDDGPGISVENLDRVFESFYQLDAGRSHGLGLGLYIARSIVDAHGGWLWVASQPGVGSTFHVRLPGTRALRGAGGD
jgi:signal transduction histidine kinase